MLGKVMNVMSRWLVAMVVLWVVAVPAVVGAEEEQDLCEVEAVVGGIDCVVDGEVEVSLRHASLFPGPVQAADQEDGEAPVGAVAHEDRHYYGVQAELYGFDPQEGAVVWRETMPAPIGELESTSEGLRVELQVRVAPASGNLAEMEQREVAVMVGDEGSSMPGRGSWDWSSTLSPLHDVMWHPATPMEAEPGGNPADLEGRTESDEEATLEWLQEVEEVYRVNPFVPLYRGEALMRMGDEQGAEQAFEAALGHPQAQWMDLSRMVLRFAALGATDWVEEAMERAEEERSRAGVRTAYLMLSFHATYGLVWFQDLMGQAMEWDDAEQIDELARVLWRLYPAVEGWEPMARGLVHYFEDRGEGHRAVLWQERYEEIGEGERLDELILDGVEATDHYLVLQIGLVLVLFLSGAILGLWRRQEQESEEDDEEGWQAYLPRFYGGDVVAVGVILAVLWALPMAFAPAVQSLITQAEAPPAVMGDGLGSPTAEEWLEGLAESPGRASLLSEAREEAEAVKSGGTGPGQSAIDEQLWRAIEADTEARQIRSMGDLEPQEQTLQEFEWLAPLIELEFEGTQSLLLFVVLAFNVAIFGGLLQAAARRLEGIRRAGIYAVVGAPNCLKWARLPVFAAFVMGLLLMSPLSRQFLGGAEQQMVSLYGLEGLEVPAGGVTFEVGAALVVLAVAVHVVGVTVDRKQWAGEERES